MPRVDETMLRIAATPALTARLWVDGRCPEPIRRHIVAVAHIVLTECTGTAEACDALLAHLPPQRINAIEVLDRFGNGHLIYPEWP